MDMWIFYGLERILLILYTRRKRHGCAICSNEQNSQNWTSFDKSMQTEYNA